MTVAENGIEGSAQIVVHTREKPGPGISQNPSFVQQKLPSGGCQRGDIVEHDQKSPGSSRSQIGQQMNPYVGLAAIPSLRTPLQVQTLPGQHARGKGAVPGKGLRVEQLRERTAAQSLRGSAQPFGAARAGKLAAEIVPAVQDQARDRVEQGLQESFAAQKAQVHRLEFGDVAREHEKPPNPRRPGCRADSGSGAGRSPEPSGHESVCSNNLGAYRA